MRVRDRHASPASPTACCGASASPASCPTRSTSRPATGCTCGRRCSRPGADLGVSPFGVEAQRMLRLEKGHFIVGQDTDGLTRAYSAGLDGLVKLDKDDFVGKPELVWQQATRGDRPAAGRPAARRPVGRPAGGQPDPDGDGHIARPHHVQPHVADPRAARLPGPGRPRRWPRPAPPSPSGCRTGGDVTAAVQERPRPRRPGGGASACLTPRRARCPSRAARSRSPGPRAVVDGWEVSAAPQRGRADACADASRRWPSSSSGRRADGAVRARPRRRRSDCAADATATSWSSAAGPGEWLRPRRGRRRARGCARRSPAAGRRPRHVVDLTHGRALRPPDRPRRGADAVEGLRHRPRRPGHARRVGAAHVGRQDRHRRRPRRRRSGRRRALLPAALRAVVRAVPGRLPARRRQGVRHRASRLGPLGKGSLTCPCLPDLEIARGATLKPLDEVAPSMGIGDHLLEPYGAAVAEDQARGDRGAGRPAEGQVRRRLAR